MHTNFHLIPCWSTMPRRSGHRVHTPTARIALRSLYRTLRKTGTTEMIARGLVMAALDAGLGTERVDVLDGITYVSGSRGYAIRRQPVTEVA